MIARNVNIRLTVKLLEQHNADCYTVRFERPNDFNYEAGDWIDIDFVETNYSGGKTYSLSSSPTESDLTISFRKGISPFKRKLQSVVVGEKMIITQYGNDYGFHLRDNRSSVLIAGGIGVAPFRSMLKEMFDVGSRNEVQLVYLNKSDDFLFKPELEEWKRSLHNIATKYVVTKDLKRKSREKLLLSLLKEKTHSYFIAGPEAMVENTEHLLLDNGVNVKDIRIDNFGNY